MGTYLLIVQAWKKIAFRPLVIYIRQPVITTASQLMAHLCKGTQRPQWFGGYSRRCLMNRNESIDPDFKFKLNIYRISNSALNLSQVDATLVAPHLAVISW